VYHNGDGTVSVSSSLPISASISGHMVDRFRVHGSRPVPEFLGSHRLGDFEIWKKARETEGLVLQLFPI
jgi:hypothetical protein